MDIIVFLLIGLVVGWIASVLVEGESKGGIRSIGVGIIGALLGGYIYRIIGITTYGLWGDISMSVIGAVVFLLVLSFFTARTKVKIS
jgi:uncharacterized membrane protein YeaQ/YmgE (transglycosylase-associated protein family)